MITVMCILLFLYFVMMIYLIIGWRQAVRHNPTSHNRVDARDDFSILIPFRNEESSLPLLLEDLSAMLGSRDTVPVFLIDDHSTDKTMELFQGIVGKFSNFRILNNDGEGKIAALRTALTQVPTDKVITLDADIRLNTNWLASVRAIAQMETDMCILPVVGIADKSLASRYAQLDFMSLIGVTFAMAAHKRPVMANGAQLLARTNSLSWQDGLVSGDDVFALHSIKKAGGKIGFALNEELIACTAMPATWIDVYEQRLRWASKAGKYRDRDTLILGWIVLAMHVGLWVLSFICLHQPKLSSLFLGMILTKALVDFLFLAAVMRWFGQLKKLWFFPIAFFIGFFQYPLLFIAGQLRGFTWKDRHYGR